MAQQITIWFPGYQGTEDQEFTVLTTIGDQAHKAFPGQIAYTVEEVADDYVCAFCGDTFPTDSAVDEHMDTNHRDED